MIFNLGVEKKEYSNNVYELSFSLNLLLVVDFYVIWLNFRVNKGEELGNFKMKLRFMF